MKIYAISNFTADCKKPHFDGQWETKRMPSHVNSYGGDVVKKVYTPDKKENFASIANAWKQETGSFPSDWVKFNNPYNQNNNDVQYEIKGYPYIPVKLLVESEKLKLSESDYSLDTMECYSQLAKFSAQMGNKQQVKEYEQEMVQSLYDTAGAKYEVIGAKIMNDYRDGFGDDTLARKRYAK